MDQGYPGFIFHGTYAASIYSINSWQLSGSNIASEGTIYKTLDSLCSLDRVDTVQVGDYGVYATGLTFIFSQSCTSNALSDRISIKYIEVRENEVFKLAHSKDINGGEDKSVQLVLRERVNDWDPPPALLDYEASSSYIITISITDQFGERIVRLS